MLTVTGIALLVASAALLVQAGPRAQMIAMTTLALIVITRRHGGAPGVALAVAAASAAVAAVVIARPLAPRVVARLPVVGAGIAGAALLLEVLRAP